MGCELPNPPPQERNLASGGECFSRGYESPTTSGIMATMGNLQLSPGSLFANRFEIMRAAGSGGMGTVYRAIDRYSGDTVALKLLHGGAGGAEGVERFLREAQLLSELRHPGIVAHVAHGQTPDGQRFLAMEWLEGQDLSERLLRGPLLVRDCVRLLEQIADALSIAHQRGIIHRDLKPTNLFLIGGDIGHVKILDFGIARRIATSQAMTRTGMVVGTPEYMAPEQARGSRELTPAVDLFSLGCVLYECLTGQPPFVADHIAAVLVRILFEEPIPIEERRPGIPAALAALLARLLTKDTAQRVSEAAALRAELRGLAELPEPALAVTMAGLKPQAESFAEQEQSLFSVVLAAPDEEAIGLDATQAGSAAPLGGTDRQALLNSLSGLGGSADFLANGTLVVTVPTQGSAQDQATFGARMALLTKERWPDAVVSMATGRGSIRGRTAVGEVVELAARALKSGSHGALGKLPTGVLIDPLSAKLLEGRFVQTPQPGGAVLLREEWDTDASRPLLGKPTPCVGRETELAMLEAQFAGCIEESEARVVLITAPAGVGKSRLRHEFLRRVERRSEPVTQLGARSELMRAGSPYGVLRTAIQKLCGISGSEALDLQRERLRARLARSFTGPDQASEVLFIGELCGIPFPADEEGRLASARSEPEIMRDQMRRAFVEWLRVECARAPVLIVLDDLHWGDALSVALLDQVLRELCNQPLFLLVLARPEVHETFPRLWAGHRIQEVVLRGLGKKACERLVQHTLGRAVSPAAMSRAVELSVGNALFLEELIRAMAEGKSEEQPDTVLAMLQARIGRLDMGPRRTLRAASIFGQRFWRSGVAAVLGVSAETSGLEQWLASLVEKELVERRPDSRLPGEQEYWFRHALLRDAAYALLTEGDQQLGHRMAGLYLESTGESDAAVIADHLERGGDRDRATVHFCAASETAIDAVAPALALRWAERGLRGEPTGELRGNLLSVESHASFLLQDMQRLAAASAAALPLLRPGSRAWGRAIHNAIVISVLGPEEARAQLPALLDQLLSVQPDEGAEGAYADAFRDVVAAMVTVAPIPQVQSLLGALGALCDRVATRNPLLRRHYLYGQVMLLKHATPKIYEMLQIGRSTVELCLRASDARVFGWALAWGVAAPIWELGDAASALALLRTHRERIEQGAVPFIVAMYHLQLAAILAESDEEAALMEATELSANLPPSLPLLTGLKHDTLARLALRHSRPAEAEVEARIACELLTNTLPRYKSSVRATLMRALLAQRKLPDALAQAEAGLAVLRSFGCLGESEVELRLAISETLHAGGQLERGHAEMKETLSQILLRAQHIPDPLSRAGYLTRNPYCIRAQALCKEWGLDIVVE